MHGGMRMMKVIHHYEIELWALVYNKISSHPSTYYLHQAIEDHGKMGNIANSVSAFFLILLLILFQFHFVISSFQVMKSDFQSEWFTFIFCCLRCWIAYAPSPP